MRYLIPFALFVSSCGPGSKDEVEHYYLKKAEHKPAAHWSYEGATGPEHWGELSPSYSLAVNGKRQSPINIDTSSVVEEAQAELIFRYRVKKKPDFINNGHTLQHEQEDDGSEIEVGGKHYRLEQFHIHTPSEHTIDGQHFPLELHMVHKAADGEIAVLAIFYKEGNSSQALKYIADVEVPSEKGEGAAMQQSIRLDELIPDKPDYYSYSGSFTTPPCTEGVRWFILKQALEADGVLLSKIADVLKANNRPVQDLNGRTVYGE